MNAPTLRFKFTPEIMNEVNAFAKLHQLDDRHSYKEAWKIWYENHTEMIQGESQRLENDGYVGDINDKMFKAGRYYFRKKTNNEDKDKTKRRNYISMDSEVIEAMDRHIKDNINYISFSPASGYNNFCKDHLSLLKNEITRFYNEDVYISQDILISKIKKTYKNRYFILTH